MSNKNWLDLDGKVCVVTGAAGGIGRATALELAAAGAKLALLDRNSQGLQSVVAELRQQGCSAIALTCDISSKDSVQEAANAVADQLGNCSALINNAGFLKSASLDRMSLDEWNAVLAVNLGGYLLCAQAFHAQMQASGRASIVNVASIAAYFPQTNSGAYSASKSAVLLLSKQLAAEWGAQGIRSNCVCPGMIKTPLSEAFYAHPGLEEKRAAMTANRRVGRPDDIANVVVFLASPRSEYVNGAELLVDGGMATMLMDLVPRPGFNLTGDSK